MSNNLTMPNCPYCGEFKKVQLSDFPSIGLCFCRECFAFFTPVNAVNAVNAVKAEPSDGNWNGPTPEYRTLSRAFLSLMDEIGVYGFEKYGEDSAESRRKRRDFKRGPRQASRENAKHAACHFEEYLDGHLHDKFNTRKHQLAAVAFNAMMEFIWSEQESN